MTTFNSSYDTLYNNLKNRFTVVNDGRECSVGDYMRMKAGKGVAADTTLPISTYTEQRSLATFVSFVNERLTVKTPPVKDKTIRRFPLRTSASAILSAVAACALVMSCGIFALTGARSSVASDSINASNGASIEMIAEDTATINEEIK